MSFLVTPRRALTIWVGFDRRFPGPFAVARQSAERHAGPIRAQGLVLDHLRARGLYRRPTEVRDGQLYDLISEHTMATEFAISRFLVPHIAPQGWALFEDCDMLTRGNLYSLFLEVERRWADKAVVCVKHQFEPSETVKMDGQVQSRYARKNWSSFMFFNVGHPANERLTLEMVNGVPGRDLHAFCWLEDDEIGEIGPEWNWLVGHSDPAIDAKTVHFTDGVPSLPGFENVAYADEWRAELNRWAA